MFGEILGMKYIRGVLLLTVPDGNAYTDKTIKVRILPHLREVTGGWFALGSEPLSIKYELYGRDFPETYAKSEVVKGILVRHYGLILREEGENGN